MSLDGLEQHQDSLFLADNLLNDDFGGLWPEGDPSPPDSLNLDFDSVFLPPDISLPEDNDLSFPRHELSTARREPEQRSGTMSRATVNILKKWFDQHPERPYPSKEEKLSLAGQTSVTVIQVSNWFANARRRQKYRFTRRGGPLNPAARRGSIELMRHGPTSLLSPLDRWRNSPPEAEAASLDAIMSAVVDSGQTNPSTRNFELQASSESTPYDNRSMDSSNASGSAVSNSPASSAYSFGSHSSNASFTQFYAAGPLRRRRRRTKPTSTLPKNTNPVGRDQRPYQCTFCTDTFRTKYDWTRHEKTLHLSLESYTCSPGGPTYTDSDGSTHCAFCDYPDPSENHLQSHSYDKCQEKPTVVRTFYRKDHLVQHLRLVHGINQLLPAMEGWKSQIDRVNSRCGFCSERFTSWSERNEHIAQHFRAGTLMSDWRGSRGIDPAVALAVENAMPPYLIGIESAAMNPFSATQMTDARLAPDDHTETGNMQRIGVKPTSFEFFTARITEFVREAQIAHETVTDSMIQTQARQIIFGDDDPWNQTPADNSEWLKLFKHGMGLDTVAAPSEESSQRLPYSDEEWSFCLPWSTEPWKPWGSLNVNSGVADILSAEGPYMPWSWQSPEALADIRRFYTEVFSMEAPEQSGELDIPSALVASTQVLGGPSPSLSS